MNIKNYKPLNFLLHEVSRIGSKDVTSSDYMAKYTLTISNDNFDCTDLHQLCKELFNCKDINLEYYSGFIPTYEIKATDDSNIFLVTYRVPATD